MSTCELSYSTPRRGLPILPLMAILAVIVTLIVVSQHAMEAHKNNVWDSTRVLDRLGGYNGGDKSLCQTFEMASCPNAITDSGKPTPQFRAYCGDKSAGVMGIFGVRFGTENPVYVTGFSLSYARWQAMNTRDRCFLVSGDWLGRMLK